MWVTCLVSNVVNMHSHYCLLPQKLKPHIIRKKKGKWDEIVTQLAVELLSHRTPPWIMQKRQLRRIIVTIVWIFMKLVYQNVDKSRYMKQWLSTTNWVVSLSGSMQSKNKLWFTALDLVGLSPPVVFKRVHIFITGALEFLKDTVLQLRENVGLCNVGFNQLRARYCVWSSICWWRHQY
jgi:hypothetical protein